MKFVGNVTSFLVLALLSTPVKASWTKTADDGDQSLRGKSTSLFESSCNENHDESSCLASIDDETNEPCSWCKCAAVPSECLSSDQAANVPPGVFDCTTPGVFKFQPGTIHHLKTKDPKYDDICDASSKSIAGYMDIKGSSYDENGENKHLFFWMFEKRNMDENQDKGEIPFLVWLTGGPGCSSTMALLTENGPCSVNDDGESTSVNPYSWTESAHVLWLDQPAGVGFSYGAETDKNEAMVSEDAYYFLQAFFQTYPEYQSSPLYFVGESYGGHYAPSIAHRTWIGNSEQKEGTIQLNLSGLAIGNGLTDPEEQYKWYPEMVYNNSHNIKIVDEGTYETMKAVVPKCTKLIHACNQGDSALDDFACQSAFLVCNMGLTSPYQMTGLNPYDIRKQCEVPPLCYDFSYIKKWVNLESTKQALNVDEQHSHSWDTCNYGINMKFHTDWMKDFSPFVSDLLDKADIPVLIYAGDVDFICNYLGNKAWTLAFDWSGHDEFNAAPDHDWNGDGLARTAKKFTFLQVYDAGHMVPTDKPEAALTMITQFMNGEAF